VKLRTDPALTREVLVQVGVMPVFSSAELICVGPRTSSADIFCFMRRR
jgi:hypothetical protein